MTNPLKSLTKRLAADITLLPGRKAMVTDLLGSTSIYDAVAMDGNTLYTTQGAFVTGNGKTPNWVGRN
jgi:hypothetical protein